MANKKKAKKQKTYEPGYLNDALALLDGNLCNLSLELDELEAALLPILTEGEPTEKTPLERRWSTHLATHIGVTAENLDAMRRRLSNLLDSIDLTME